MKAFLKSFSFVWVLILAALCGGMLKDLILGPPRIEVQFVLPPAEIEPQPEPQPCNVPVI